MILQIRLTEGATMQLHMGKLNEKANRHWLKYFHVLPITLTMGVACRGFYCFCVINAIIVIIPKF